LTRREEILYEIRIPPLKYGLRVDSYKAALSHQPWLLNEQCKEQVLCLHCGDGVNVYRHRSRTQKVNTLGLSTRFSTYMPQGLQHCGCEELGVLVDHKGRTRVYSNDSAKVSVLFPLLGLTTQAFATQNLSLCKVVEGWVDQPYDYTPEVRGRKTDYDMVNHLNLWAVTEKNQRQFLPYPPDITRLDFYKNYANTFLIVLLVTVGGRRKVVFPDGAVLEPKLPDSHPLLNVLTSAEDSNQEVLKLYTKLYLPILKVFRKNSSPHLKLISYPKKLVPFLQVRRFEEFPKDRHLRHRTTHLLRKHLRDILKLREDLRTLPTQGWYLRCQELHKNPLRSPQELPPLLEYYLRNPHKAIPYNLTSGRRQ